jgi:membrane-bound serine protease (ClpP class)
MSTIGLLMMLVGAALLVAEAHVPTHGALGTGGVVALIAGAVFVFASAGVAAGIVLAAVLGVALAGMGWLYVLVRKAVAARRLAVRSGAEGLVGRVGTVRAVPAPFGQVFVDGALWRARVWELEGEAPLSCGDAVVVEHVDGLTLTVRPAEKWEVS